MEWLLHNPIASMYGPYFLGFYAFIAFISYLFFAYYKRQILDKIDESAIPPVPARPDIYEIASLSGGIERLLETVVAELLVKKIIFIDNDAKLAANAAVNKEELNAIEESIFSYLKKSNASSSVKAVCSFGKMLDQMKEVLTPYYSKFEDKFKAQGLLVTEAQKKQIKLIGNRILVLLLGLGVYKITASLIKGYTNVLFLVILMTFTLIFFLILFHKQKIRLTGSGKYYLAQLKTLFGKRQEAPNQWKNSTDREYTHSANFSVTNPLLLLSLGMANLGGLSYFGVDGPLNEFDRLNCCSFRKTRYELTGRSTNLIELFVLIKLRVGKIEEIADWASIAWLAVAEIAAAVVAVAGAAAEGAEGLDVIHNNKKKAER
jgi:uncharacterized protein (TIGR04222 family)